MFRRSILSIALCIFTIHQIFGDPRQAKSSIFQINHKKPIHAVSDKFLSFTVDPTTLLHVADCQLTNATLSLIRGLLPAYLRVAGTDSNRLLFKSLSDGAASSSKSRNLVLSGNQWNKFYEFVSSTGLNLVVCLSGGIFNEQTDRDLSNALEFINFSNKNNFNMNWQLGYELQKISRDDGKVTGQDVAKLRKILEVFPRYQNSLIVGPDVTDFDSRENIIFLRNYLLQAQNSLNAFTIHPNFSTISDKDLYNSLAYLFAKMDSYLWLKDGIFKTTSKGVVPKKPIWIAESENKEANCKFSDSMSLIKRLGFAAKLGASVYLRKPHLLSIYEPTSEFWAASLFKALVGRLVLDTKLTGGSNSSLVVFSHCTQILEKPEESIINPTLAYERGSITAYGVNTESEPVRLVLRTGIKTDETVHMYVLTEDSRHRMGKTMLNRQHLGLSDENDLPMLSPMIHESAESIVVPAHSIFFFVFPDVRCRACMQQLVEDIQEATKTKINLSIPDEEELLNTSETSASMPENLEEPEDENAVYVSYPTKGERIKAAHEHWPEITELPQEIKQLESDSPAIPSKYITFSDDTWLSSFPEKFKETEKRLSSFPEKFEVIEKRSSDGPQNSLGSPMEKYRVLAQAIIGQRNVTATSLTQGEEGAGDSEANKGVEGQTKRLTRSVASLPIEINSLYQQIGDSSRYSFVPHDRPISDDLEESNNIPSYWHQKSRNRRDVEDDSFVQDSFREVMKIFEELPKPNNTILSTTEGNLFNSTSIKRPQSTLPELVIEPEGFVGQNLFDSTAEKMNQSMVPEWVTDPEEYMNIRPSREIDAKSVVAYKNLASDPKIEDSNVAASFGPVSPFPRHHSKPTKTKSKSSKVKKMGKSLDAYQNQSDEDNSSEANPEMSFTSAQLVDTTEESAASNTRMKSSDIPAENQSTPSLTLDPTTPPSMEDSGNSAKNVPPTASTARNADTPVSRDISPKHATNEPIVSKVVPTSMHSATRNNKAKAHSSHPVHHTEDPVHPIIHSRTKDVKAKAASSNSLNDFVKKLKDDASRLQTSHNSRQIIDLAHARIQELLNIYKARMEERQRKIQEAAVKRQVGRSSIQGRSKRETINPVPEPNNSLDQRDSDNDKASARQVQQIGHVPTHLHGSTETSVGPAPVHLHESSEAPSRIAPIHLHKRTKSLFKIEPTHLQRSTEAPSRTAPTHLHRSTEAPSKTAPTHRHKSTETSSKTVPTHLRRSTEAPNTAPTHLHKSTEAPSKTAPTHPHRITEAPRTAPVPRREKPTRKPFQVPHKNTHDTRHTTTKPPLADKYKARLHSHESNLDRHQLQKRDLINDLFSKVKHVYDDVSTEVQKDMAPVEKWVEERAKDVKHEFNEFRFKRDLEALKEKVRERKEKLRQKFEEIRQQRTHKRDVRSHHQQPRPAHHFDEKIKDHEKHFPHAVDLKKKMKLDHERSREHKNKIAEILKHKSEISSHVEPDRNRFVRSLSSDNSFEQEKQENEIIFNENFNTVAEFNKSSAYNSGPQILGNFSDILSPPERKSVSSNERQCNETNFLLGLWCEATMLFSNFFSSS